jgi:hypothetical protein
MAFNILTIRTGEADDGRLYPVLGDEHSMVELEPLDGAVLSLAAVGVSVSENVGGQLKQLIRYKEIKADILITESRVVVACSKYEKGGGWIGFGGGGAVVALGLNAVSKARAAHRRKGKMLVGHVRYQWLSQVGHTPKSGFGTSERVRLRIVESVGGSRRDLVLDISLPRNVSSSQVAGAIANRAARFRLDHSDVPNDKLQVFRGLASAGVVQGVPKKYTFYTLPNYFFANFKTSETGTLYSAEKKEHVG